MSLPSMNTLIVDDNATDRIVAKAMLEKFGIRQVQEAQDGVIAEKKILMALEIGKPFDLIFLDWQMPRENGLGILKMIRTTSRLKSTKVIMMTGTADMGVVQKAIQLDVDDFIVKPLTFESLEVKLQKILKVSAKP